MRNVCSLPGLDENSHEAVLVVIAIKINSQDFSEGGFNVEESKEMAIWLESAGVDIIELSGGTYESTAFRHVTDSTKAREAFFIE